MWRKCDLHIHTTPNEQAPEQPLDAVDLVRRCLDRDLSVVAITDHDHARNVEAVVAAAGDKLFVVAGIEVTTDHGHLLILAPSANGSAVIQEHITDGGLAGVVRPQKHTKPAREGAPQVGGRAGPESLNRDLAEIHGRTFPSRCPSPSDGRSWELDGTAMSHPAANRR
jgi:hypothetical protein